MTSSASISMIKDIYVITDETLVEGRTHLDIARAAVEGGASVIQLRDKHASDKYMTHMGKEIRRLTSQAGVLFIVNDRVEVAIACEADGLHIGQQDRSLGEIRHLVPDMVIGVSVESPEQATRARLEGADYLGVGPIFVTLTKEDAGQPLGVAWINLIRPSAGDLPIVAIGGINEGNIAQIAASGVDSAAIISAIVKADDMAKATRRFVRIWNESIGTLESS